MTAEGVRAELRQADEIRADLAKIKAAPSATLLNQPAASMRLLHDVEPLLAERDALAEQVAQAKAQARRLRAIAEPECVCAHVDIGVGMLKVDDDRSCPACWPDARHEYEHRKHVEAELTDARAVLARAEQREARVRALVQARLRAHPGDSLAANVAAALNEGDTE